MAHDDPTPAIARDYTDADDEPEVRSVMYDSVTFTPGMGDSGYRIEAVEHTCPNCDFDRMVRRVDVRPEWGTEVRYWCLYPNCPHYLSDTFSYAFHGREIGGREPVIFE